MRRSSVARTDAHSAPARRPRPHVPLDTDRALAAGAPQRTLVVAPADGSIVADGSIAVRPQRAATLRRGGALLAEATLAIEARFAEPDLAIGDVAREIAISGRPLQRVFAELTRHSVS